MTSNKATQDSPRVIMTKERIKTAFLQLMSEKNIEQISIREITDLAELNRATFYRYYQDIFDLYHQIMDEYFGQLQLNLTRLFQCIARHGALRIEDTPLDFFYENQAVLKIMLQDPSMIERIKSQNKTHLRKILALPEHDNSIDYILEYLLAGQIGLISYWLQNQQAVAMEDLFPLIKAIFFSGPMTVLFEKSQIDPWHMANTAFAIELT